MYREDGAELVVSVWTGRLGDCWPPDVESIRSDAFATSSLRSEEPPWNGVVRACWIARARQGEQLVGFGLLTDCGTGEAVLDEIGVIAGQRGRGIGSEILNRLRDVATTAGFRLIQTTPMRGDNREADRLTFFARAGFSDWHHGLALHLQRPFASS